MKISPEQWANAGEAAARFYCEQHGIELTDSQAIEARVVALQIAFGDDPDIERTDAR
jgi:hypothetical protein